MPSRKAKAKVKAKAKAITITLPYLPTSMRLSNALVAVRESDYPEVADRMDAYFRRVGCQCHEHGAISDPIVVFFGTQFIFVCPDCCSDPVLDAYLSEGSRSSQVEESSKPSQDGSRE